MQSQTLYISLFSRKGIPDDIEKVGNSEDEVKWSRNAQRDTQTTLGGLKRIYKDAFPSRALRKRVRMRYSHAVTNNGALRSVICFAWFKAGFAALQTKYAANLLATFNEDKADTRSIRLSKPVCARFRARRWNR